MPRRSRCIRVVLACCPCVVVVVVVEEEEEVVVVSLSWLLLGVVVFPMVPR